MLLAISCGATPAPEPPPAPPLAVTPRLPSELRDPAAVSSIVDPAERDVTIRIPPERLDTERLNTERLDTERLAPR